MKLPVYTINTTIYDATGMAVATCGSLGMTHYIAERINEFAAQYARGHADAVELVNRQRDYETACTRQRIEERQYEQALQEEVHWSLTTFVHAA